MLVNIGRGGVVSLPELCLAHHSLLFVGCIPGARVAAVVVVPNLSEGGRKRRNGETCKRCTM